MINFCTPHNTKLRRHAERSEASDNESTADGSHGFFATLRMTHLLGLSALELKHETLPSLKKHQNMKKEVIQKLHTSFEGVAHDQDGVEFWLARDLQVLLGYEEWRNFTRVLERAQEACENAGVAAEDQFVEVNKLITHAKGGQRSIADFMLTRYACYLIAQNGDPAKEPIAFAQTYFAVQTRKQELIEERLQLMERLQAREKLEATESELSRLIYERGVDNQGFARIRSNGDAALFGGSTTAQMKKNWAHPITARLLTSCQP